MKKLTALKIAAAISVAGAATVCIATIATLPDTESIYVSELSHSAYTKETTNKSDDWVNNSTYDNIRNLSEMDKYLLAKLVMAEAEDDSLYARACIALVVLNRVDDPGFPNTVRDVIFQEGQFLPLDDGRWEEAEPSTSAWSAVNFINTGWDESEGATYFAAKGCSKWHNENLKYLYTEGSHAFYKERI